MKRWWNQHSIRTYDCFLVLDARIVSVEGARYYGPSADAKALPSLVYDRLQAPCIVAVPQPEPVFSWHSGGYSFCDSVGAVVARA